MTALKNMDYLLLSNASIMVSAKQNLGKNQQALINSKTRNWWIKMLLISSLKQKQ